MVTHVDLEDIVIGNQVAGQDTQIIEAAEQAVDENDGRIIVQVLCRLRSDIQFHSKVLFFALSG